MKEEKWPNGTLNELFNNYPHLVSARREARILMYLSDYQTFYHREHGTETTLLFSIIHLDSYFPSNGSASCILFPLL